MDGSGWGAPGLSWRALEQALSGRAPAAWADGNDAPAWTRRRAEYRAPLDAPAGEAGDRVPFVELHAHSSLSFLDGASDPEELVTEAARLGLTGLALTDHDGLYGAARLATATAAAGLSAVYGAELSVGLTRRQNGIADPEGEHLLVLARDAEGYRRLCRVISSAHLRGGEKGRPVYDWAEIVEETRDHGVVLTGCRKSAVRRALAEHGPAAAMRELRGWVDAFGSEAVVVELTDHGQPGDDRRNATLVELAREVGVAVVATNAVHYATPARGGVAVAMAAVRARRSIADMRGWLPAAPMAYLRSGAEMLQRCARWPHAVHAAARLGRECAFDWRVLAPRLPPFTTPDGQPEAALLRELTMRAAGERYGPPEVNREAYRQLEHELAVIDQLGFPGYFLVVWDIMRFCREQKIVAQGRGSAANSAVCFLLGITNADPVRWGLLFERFLNPERDEPPDIDVDIEADRREEVIQYVYGRYGRRHTAQVANVITYRAPLAVQDAGLALGYSPEQRDAWSKRVDRHAPLPQAARDAGVPDEVAALAGALVDRPRHLGVHSGGMVITEQPVSEIVPVEWATKVGRTVIQWDKDDCEHTHLVKFDLLGLGALSAVHYALDLIAEHEHQRIDLAALDLADPAVYDMLCRADAVGVFQVESRAQLSALPRLKPRTFYDLTVQVAIIRPGPIQGGSVHPYIRRRNGEPWTHPHPSMRRALDRTLGVPLFQEQVLQLAVDCAGFTPGEADQLRRAMTAKRSTERMQHLRQRFLAGAADRGLPDAIAQRVFTQIRAFSGYGFPEAHAMSFAHLVFATAWLKRYHPAALLAGLLRAQPMGFYAPSSLVADAKRHGITVHRPDLNTSTVHPTLIADPGSGGGVAVRLGLAGIRDISADTAERIVEHRAGHGPYASLRDLASRVLLTPAQREALAAAGALDTLEGDRRAALWQAGLPTTPDGQLTGLHLPAPTPALPGMSALELVAADLWATGTSPTTHPVAFLRDQLDARGIITAATLPTVTDGTRIHIAGAVTHRQRPATASGITFLNLEDETGMANIVCSPGLWNTYRVAATTSAALIVRGIAQATGETTSVLADRLEPLNLGVTHTSRDFR